MMKTENDCFDCSTEGYPCLGDRCPFRNVKHFYCDKCGDEAMLYHFDGQELCESCLLNEFEVVGGSEND